MRNETHDYLEKEVAELNRGFKLSVGALVLITVLLVGYFEWLKGMVAEIVEPQNISTLAVSEVRRNLPAARIAMETNLTNAAPEVIEFVADQVLEEALPLMTQSARALFREYSRELAGFGNLAMARSFEEIVKDHSVELRKSVETAEAGRFTADKIAESLNKTVKSELGRRLTESPEESLKTKLAESLGALRNINDRLKEMANSPKLDRKDELGRKLITTWWTFLNRDEGNKSAQQMLLEQNAATVVTDKEDPSVPGDGVLQR